MRRKILKIRPNFCCEVVRTPDTPRKHPLASICFQPNFFDKKSPDSLWNLGLSDLHLLRSEQLAAEPGFEPRRTESESAVLPLHNSALCVPTDVGAM